MQLENIMWLMLTGLHTIDNGFNVGVYIEETKKVP